MKIIIFVLSCALGGAAMPTSTQGPQPATCCEAMEATARSHQILMDRAMIFYSVQHMRAAPDTTFGMFNINLTFFPTQEHGFTPCQLKLEHEELHDATLWFKCREPTGTLEIVAWAVAGIALLLVFSAMGAAFKNCFGRKTRDLRKRIAAFRAPQKPFVRQLEEQQDIALLEKTVLNMKRSTSTNGSTAEDDEDSEQLDTEVTEILQKKPDGPEVSNQIMEHNSDFDGSQKDGAGFVPNEKNGCRSTGSSSYYDANSSYYYDAKEDDVSGSVEDSVENNTECTKEEMDCEGTESSDKKTFDQQLEHLVAQSSKKNNVHDF